MPTFELQSPDGKKYHIEGPEGATEAQAYQVLQQQLKAGTIKPAVAPAATQKPPVAAPSLNRDIDRNITGAIAEPLANMATSAIAKPLSDIAGLAATGVEMLGNKKREAGDPEAFKKYVQEQLTYQPRTVAGQAVAEYNPLALLAKGYGAGTHAIGQGIRGINPQSSIVQGIGNLTEETLNQVPGVAGAKIGAEAAGRAAEAQKALDIEKGVKAPLDAVRNQSQAAGLTTPVEGTSWISGIPGMSKINKWVSGANEPKVNRLIAENFGLPKGVSLTKDELAAVRAKKGAAYQAVIDAGYGPEQTIRAPSTPSTVLDSTGKPIMLQGPEIKVKPGWQTTPEFTQAINKELEDVTKKIAYDPETFHGLIPSAKLLRQYLRSEHDPKMTMDQIEQLRKDAATEFKSDDPTKIASAFTRKEIANQLENMIESNLQKTGQTKLLAEFRDARKTIAQTYDVESALDNVGNVNARKLYLISQKRPLSGNLKTVADYAGAFPEGVQKVPKGQQAVSPWDWMFSVGSIAAGHPLVGLTEIMGRAGIPMLAIKGALQKKTPSYIAKPRGEIAAPSIGIETSQNQQQ